jgi:hypothetical protein
MTGKSHTLGIFYRRAGRLAHDKIHGVMKTENKTREWYKALQCNDIAWIENPCVTGSIPVRATKKERKNPQKCGFFRFCVVDAARVHMVRIRPKQYQL